jgi:membrane peptidoglycan carboxypeptidase
MRERMVVLHSVVKLFGNSKAAKARFGRRLRELFGSKRTRRIRLCAALGQRLGTLQPIIIIGAATVSIALVARFLHSVSAVTSPQDAIAAMADYGGAQIFDRDGRLLYRYPDRAGGVRIPLQPGQVSQWMIDATVSTEDAGFWTSGGFDPLRTMRAAAANVTDNGSPFIGSGGSGITQQLVKQTLIAPDQRDSQSLNRKFAEALIAIGLTRTYSKSQILTWYLDVVNYGGAYDGVESAAEGYFGVHAADLDLAQSAMLAGIPQSPAAYSPYLNSDGSKERQAEILDLMVRHNYVSQERADAAKSEILNYQPAQQALVMRAPWFVEYVREQLIVRFGEQCFETCGLQVRTSLDLDLEDKASQILDANLTRWGDPIGVNNGALVSIDARNGEILVMVGSRDYANQSQAVQGMNNFATAVSQPGSSFKPFVYLSLFMHQGYGPASIIWDAPFKAAGGYQCQDPVQGGRTQGPIPVRLALGSSLNCAANRAAQVTGVQSVFDTAHAMGITTMSNANDYGASIATGGANITLLDMTFAYTTLARNGSMIGETATRGLPIGYRRLEPSAVLEVKDGQGRTLYRPETQTAQVVPAGFPYLITGILSDCSNRRLIWPCGFPAFGLADGRPVAVKTGTQQGNDLGHTIANWQYMYTPQTVTGGWVGNADRSAWTDVSGGANAVGYSVQQLEQAVTDQDQIPATDFPLPDDLRTASVHVPDGSRGLVGGCGPIEQALFVSGTAPDVNNRVCVQGRIVIPEDQRGTGGLSDGFAPQPSSSASLPPQASNPLQPRSQPPGGPPKPRSPGRRGH